MNVLSWKTIKAANEMQTSTPVLPHQRDEQFPSIPDIYMLSLRSAFIGAQHFGHKYITLRPNENASDADLLFEVTRLLARRTPQRQ